MAPQLPTTTSNTTTTTQQPTAAAANDDPSAADSILASIPALRAAHCHMRQPARVATALAAICADGASHAHLVTDFDHTVTRPYRTDDDAADAADTPSTQQHRIPSSFGVLAACPSLSAACRSGSAQLTRHFYPIQQDRSIPLAERCAAMLEWWQRTNELYRGERLPRAEIRAAARDAFGVRALRAGAVELFARLAAERVPVLVFSAGLADGVRAVLADTGLMTANVEVMGNWLVYRDDDDGSEEILEGFDAKRIVHAFNKNEHALEQIGGGRQLWDRRNVIVMGDSLGDAEMADGVPEGGQVLKIGFLCEQVEDNLAVFMEHFDIVLVNDHTMDVPRAILERICGGVTEATTT